MIRKSLALQFIRLLTVLTVLAAVTAVAGSASAQNLVKTRYAKKHRSMFGIKAGIINRTTMRIGGEDYTSKVGISGQAYMDFPVHKRVMFGLSIDLHDMQVFYERQVAIEPGFSLKFPIYAKHGEYAIKPGIGGGWAYLAEMGFLESSDYFTYRAFVDFVVYTQKKHSFMGELAVLHAPSGGNKDFDINFGPVILVRAGVIF